MSSWPPTNPSRSSHLKPTPHKSHPSTPPLEEVDPIPPRPPWAQPADARGPKTTVITCTYNRADMLRAACESLRRQTDGDWEHLIVDDGSDDPAHLLALEEIAGDPRVRVFPRPHVNQPARYWNEMIDLAAGRYVCFLDDDNPKQPSYLKILSGALDANPETDAVTCGFTILENGLLTDNHWNLLTAEDIWKRNTVDSGCVFFRREALERVGYFPLDIRTNEDWAIMRRTAACLRMEHRSECLVTYRVHDGQRMKTCESLGNMRDRVTIEGMGRWEAEIGVNVHQPHADAARPGDGIVVDRILRGLSEAPWVKWGTDLVIAVGPSRCRAPDARLVACVCLDEADVAAAAEWARSRRGELQETWGVGLDVGVFEALRKIGQRAIFCPLEEAGSERAVRARTIRFVNAIRSRRFEATIP